MLEQRTTHEQCPRCALIGKDRHADNLGVFPDGSKWCFSCGYHKSSDALSLHRIAAQQQKQKDKKDAVTVSLPDDFTVALPEVADKWLKNYGITDAEIAEHKIGWSQSCERLIFPVFGARSSELLMWQGRSFDPSRPKYYTQGFSEKVFHVLGDTDDNEGNICLVEDIISAIKVSRAMPCMPLWGSILSTPRAAILSDLYKGVILWLDADKQEYATKRSIALRPLFERQRVIVTSLDPKCYSTIEILEILEGDINED